MNAYSATQSRAAVSTIVSRTGCSSDGARLITLRTSEVAVWYSRDSCSSRVRAWTWSNSHVLNRNHRLVGEGSYELDLLIGERSWRRSRHRHDADAASFAQQRDTQHGAEARELSALVA